MIRAFNTAAGRKAGPLRIWFKPQVVIMDEDLRKLRQDVAVDLSPSSPAVIQVPACSDLFLCHTVA